MKFLPNDDSETVLTLLYLSAQMLFFKRNLTRNTCVSWILFAFLPYTISKINELAYFKLDFGFNNQKVGGKSPKENRQYLFSP